MISLILHDGDMAWSELPIDKDLLYGLMGYARNLIDPETMGRYLDPGKRQAQINLFFADHTSENLLRIRNAAQDFFEKYPRQIEKGEFKLAGGRIGLEIAVNEDFVEKAVNAIIEGAKTGQVGDGKIFVLDLGECVRIRTGDKGKKAIG